MATLNNNSPIGVFDSGLGGLSVLREMVKLMPGEDYIYFGDSINAPYGVRNDEEVKELTINNVTSLLDMGAKAICVACNTATSAAVADLRIIYPDIPLVGIEPALKPAVESKDHPKILVMATPMTIRKEKFARLLSRFEDQAQIIGLPCPGLMEFIEHGILSGNKLESFLKQLLWDYIDADLDGVVLGCTHYPFVKNEIQKTLGGSVPMFDGSFGTARELKRRIELAGLTSTKEKGSVRMLNSDETQIDLANYLFKLP